MVDHNGRGALYLTRKLPFKENYTMSNPHALGLQRKLL